MSTPNLADLARSKLEEVLELTNSLGPFQTPMILEALLTTLAKDRDHMATQLHAALAASGFRQPPDESTRQRQFSEVAPRVEELLQSADPDSPLPANWLWGLWAMKGAPQTGLGILVFQDRKSLAQYCASRCGHSTRRGLTYDFGVFVRLGTHPIDSGYPKEGQAEPHPDDTQEWLDLRKLYDELGGGG